MTSSPRTVFTGLGAVCGSGLTLDTIWDAIVSGRSAIAPITQWDSSQWPAPMAAEVVGVNNRTLVEDRKLHKIISRTDLFGLYAAGIAIQQSGAIEHRETLDASTATHFNDRSGIFCGSGGGVYQNNYDYLPLVAEAGGDLQVFGHELSATVSPMWLLKRLPNNVLCHLGIRTGFKGTNGCVTNHCTGGAQAVAESGSAIRAGEADRMIAIGHDAQIDPENILNFHRHGLLSNETIRSFDADRSGTILGEGAGAVVLETAQSAQSRGTAILGEYLGSGCAGEASGTLAVRPDGEGVSRATELALSDAGVSASDVGMIVAHGNGSRASDASEALGIRQIFGDHSPPVTSFKWAYGHLIAASGVLDLVMALTALRQRVVPGIATLRSLDPEIAYLPVSSQPQKPRSEIALVICRGFGGMNVVLAVRGAE